MTDTNHIEAEVSAVIKRLTGCPDIIGYGGESLAGEISRALSARASAGEGVKLRKASDYVDGVYGPDDLAAIWNACCKAHKSAAQQPAQTQGDEFTARPSPVGDCPHKTRCDCLGACKYGFAGNGAMQNASGGRG